MPRIRTAHKFSERQRTGDVLTDELVDFKSLLLSPDVLKGLSSSGFERPSPIQLKAIPLGRCGLDLISQAKSGTGKTCVFSVIALESLSLGSNTTQVLILAPTREIAVQIKEVITSIGSQMDDLICHVFIGGLPVEDNKKVLKKPCHIAVGTPGRIKFLIDNHFLKTESVRLFILDEADKLLEDNFQEQINWIFSSLPSNKQMMAFSATYPEYLAKHLTRYMREPTFVRLNATDLTLQGIKQFYKLVPFHPLPHKIFQEKVSELLNLLSTLPFQQCLVFSNYQIRAQSLCDTLRLKGWPSVFIAGSQSQSQRLKAMEKLKEFKCRVLISTDLTSRGIDAEHVNLVVNMDVPRDSETYLHRIGRAGRFGTQGIAVTFVAQGEEYKLFKRMEENIGITIDTLPDPIPQSLCTSAASSGLEQPGAASVEVDILTNSSMKASESKLAKNIPELSTVQTSTRWVDSGNMVGFDRETSCPGELAETDSHENNAKIMENQDELPLMLQIKDGADLLPENNQGNSVTAVTQETLETLSPCAHSYENENFDGKHFQKALSNCDVNLLLRHETDGKAAVTFQETSKVVLQTELIKRSEEKMMEQSSMLVPSTKKSSSLAEENEDVLSQDLTLGSHPESKGFHKSTLHFQTDACDETRQGVDNKRTKNEEFGYKMVSSSADDKELCESLSDEESSNSNSSEVEETPDDLERDVHTSSSEEERELSEQLPSVEEFEKDFEKYMENIASCDHLGEVSPISSEFEDEVADDGCSQCECKLHGTDIRDENYDKAAAKACMSSHNLDVSNDSHNHYKVYVHQEVSPTGSHVEGASFDRTFEESCRSPQHFDAFPDTCNPIFHHEDNTAANCNMQDRNCYQTTQNSNSYLYPEWYVHHDSDNYYDNYDSHYNYYAHPGNYGANHSAHRGTHPASWQQCFDQSFGDMGSYQEYQWNTSWYNAYHRQTSCIKQFVSFSRTVRF